MGRSKLKTIELEICRLLASRLAGDGYKYRKDPEVNVFERSNGDSSWKFSFHLWGSGPYYFIDSVWVAYDAYFAVLRDLLDGTSFANSMDGFGAPSDHISNYWPKPGTRSVLSLEAVPEFADDFLAALGRATEQFLVPHSDAARVANDCTLFYTKWPRGMGPINTAYYLIAYGIQQRDFQMIRLGVDRIAQKIDLCRMDHERGLALAIKDAAILKVASQ